jgi:hypothetical protein
VDSWFHRENFVLRYEVLMAVKTIMLALRAKMEAVCSSETSVSTYQTTRHYNQEDKHLKNSGLPQLHCIPQVY